MPWHRFEGRHFVDLREVVMFAWHGEGHLTVYLRGGARFGLSTTTPEEFWKVLADAGLDNHCELTPQALPPH